MPQKRHSIRFAMLVNDRLAGGFATDRLIEEIATPSDLAVGSLVKLETINGGTSYTMTGLGTDTTSEIEAITLAGSAGQDQIDVKKFRGSVTLSGNGGNDTLIGGAGNDKLTGNGGTNQLGGVARFMFEASTSRMETLVDRVRSEVV